MSSAAHILEAVPGSASQGVPAASPSASRTRRTASATDAINLLPKLLDACRWGNGGDVVQLGSELVAKIEATHPGVAERLRKRLGSNLQPRRLPIPDDLVELREPRHCLRDVVLPPAVELECRALINEHNRAEELRRFRLRPRHKVLLYGPPGNGKTLLAEGLARELDVPFLPVKYGGLVESYLGATGKNLQKVFDYASSGPCVLFMDEFDGVAIDRADSQDVGEIRRVTNQLLILMDRLPSSCVFIGATNAESLLDRAAHRRFDFVLEIPSPSDETRLRVATRELSVEMTPGHDVSNCAEAVARLDLPNLSALVNRCERIRRDLVLNGGADIQRLTSVV